MQNPLLDAGTDSLHPGRSGFGHAYWCCLLIVCILFTSRSAANAQQEVGCPERLICDSAPTFQATVQNQHAPRAQPNQQLLKAVGSDVGICLEINDFKKHAELVRSSPIFERLQSLSLYRRWQKSQEFKNLQSAQGAIEKLTKKPIGEFVSELFGQSVILAIYPITEGQAASVFLTKTENSKVLLSAIDAWNQADRPKIEKRVHQDHDYFRREKVEPKEIQFYTRLDDIFVLSNNEKSLQRSIRLWKSSGEKSLTSSDDYRKAAGSLTCNAFAKMYFNPRAWDKQILDQQPDNPLLSVLWTQFRTLMIGVEFNDEIIIEATAQIVGSQDWSRFVEVTKGNPQFLQLAPSNAVAVFAGRFNPSLLGQLEQLAQDEKQREQFEIFRQVTRGMLLGKDLFSDVLPKLGFNWGVYLVAREKLQRGAIPVDGLLAIELPVAKADDAKPIREALNNGLNTGMILLATFFNSRSPDKAALVRSNLHAKVLIRSIENFDHYEPTFALTKQYLVFSTTPRLVRGFVDRENAAVAPKPMLASQSKKYVADSSQLVVLNLRQFRRFLERNREFFQTEAMQSQSVNEEVAEEKLTNVIEVLQLLDQVFVAIRFDKTQIRFVAGGSTDSGDAK